MTSQTASANYPTLITLNLDYLRSFSQGDKAFEKDMLSSSLEESEEKMQLFESFLNQRKYAQLKGLAHSLKSMMSIIGSVSLFNCFNNIEKNISADELPDFLSSDFEKITEEWTQTKEKVTAILSTYE